MKATLATFEFTHQGKNILVFFQEAVQGPISSAYSPLNDLRAPRALGTFSAVIGTLIPGRA